MKFAKKLNEKGFSATLDLLGEEVENRKQTNQIRNSYCELLDGIANWDLRNQFNTEVAPGLYFFSIEGCDTCFIWVFKPFYPHFWKNLRKGSGPLVARSGDLSSKIP